MGVDKWTFGLERDAFGRCKVDSLKNKVWEHFTRLESSALDTLYCWKSGTLPYASYQASFVLHASGAIAGHVWIALDFVQQRHNLEGGKSLLTDYLAASAKWEETKYWEKEKRVEKKKKKIWHKG